MLPVRATNIVAVAYAGAATYRDDIRSTARWWTGRSFDNCSDRPRSRAPDVACYLAANPLLYADSAGDRCQRGGVEDVIDLCAFSTPSRMDSEHLCTVFCVLGPPLSRVLVRVTIRRRVTQRQSTVLASYSAPPYFGACSSSWSTMQRRRPPARFALERSRTLHDTLAAARPTASVIT
ncbi:hypothetical protein EXIGLDRAFT_315140 [Exidia glandulosa HHB12029]|uniref:Uncharacterized protein n=1 Tax=Exidia glandulosa HHB12029 TaxID=1314781 RepID=A0A165CYB2_EXIGL|nr:hypothetical protein EXIGLDRAFT_315140 [Exidia glandulosa HHB12029]